MWNVPIDMLRAFVAIIDLRGYTRAGERLGRTQPAISLQMKRLQELLGVSLFVKEGGMQLTENGEVVAGYARQILALNDEMMLKLSNRNSKGKLRLGIPNDYAEYFLPRLLGGLDHAGSGITFDVVCDVSQNLLQGLHEGRFDIVIAMTAEGTSERAFMTWKEPLAWVGSGQPEAMLADSSRKNALRVVCYPEGCLYRRAMLEALQREGRNFDIVYTSASLTGLGAAVSAGIGLTVLARRIVPSELPILASSERLPLLSDAVVGIYVSPDRSLAGVSQSFAARLADLFVAGHGSPRAI